MSNSAAQTPDGEAFGAQVMRTVRGVLGVIVILSAFVFFNPSWGSWTRLAVIPLVICVGLFALAVTIRVLKHVNKSRTDRLIKGLEPLFGPTWNPKTDLVARKFENGRPKLLKIDYPDSIVDSDPEWRKRVEAMAQQRMEADQVTSEWDSRRGRVVISAKTKTTAADREEDARQQAQQRMHDLLRPMFGTDLKITVTEWQDTEKGES